MAKRSWTAWQKGMVALFNSDRFCEKFKQVVAEHARGSSDPDILLSAFQNYYSYKNPGFGANHWVFSRTKSTLKTTSKGIFVETEEGASLALSEKNSLELAAAVGKERWLKTFLSKFPTK